MSFTPPGAVAPLPLAEIAPLSGHEVLRRMLAGELPAPPFSVATDIWPIELEEGRVVFAGDPSPAFLNPIGTVHGGWTAAILDSAMACAIHSTLKPGQVYTTTSMTVNFVRAVMPATGRVRCEGTVTYTGARVATSEGKLYDGRGRLLAHGTETCLIMDAPARG